MYINIKHTNIHSNDDKEYDPMELAAALESRSSHPLANAIVSDFCPCIAEMEKEFPKVNKLAVLDGIGLSGWVEVNDDWKFVNVGNERILKAHGGVVSPKKEQQVIIDLFLSENAG